MNTILKFAGSEQDFEQGFFQLAYDKLQSKLFNLLPFMVGFELVKKNDDGTKAVGVFGFKSGNGQIIYVPAFFVNGKVKDMEIMYSRNNNQFYPLNEDFAMLFLKDDITGIGSVADESKEELMKTTNRTNMRDLMHPPRTGRIAYASVKEDEEFNKDMNKTASDQMPYTTSWIQSPSLTEFLSASNQEVKTAFWQLLEKDAAYADAVNHFYTPEELIEALIEKQAVELKEPSPLRVVRFDDEHDFSKETEATKKEVATKGISIVDNRTDDKKSRVGFFKYTETFTNPTSSGLYPYVTEMGTLHYGLVLMKPVQLHTGFAVDEATLLDLDAERTGQAYFVEPKNIFVKDQIVVKDYADVHKSLEEPAESLPSYSDYILVNENLVSTQAFRIIENFKDSAGVRRIKVEPSYFYNDGPVCSSRCSSDGRKERYITLVLTKRTGDKLEFKNHAVYVPKGFKLLRVWQSDDYYNTSIECGDSDSVRADKRKKADEERARLRQGKPGGLYALEALLAERNILPLTVQTNGSEYFLNVNGLKTKFKNALEVKLAMVTGIGMEEKTAEEIIGKITPSHKMEGCIKIAYLGDQILPVEEESPGVNEFGQPTYYGIPYIGTADTSDGYTGDPTQMGLGVKPDVDSIQGNIQNASQLAQSGQKEIFDTQSIATLARYSDPQGKIMGYIPTFVSSLDKLGRMLFMVYWETEKFQQMYGQDELPELLELVKNVFNNLGDLIIFMKRKVPDLNINNNEQANDAI